MALPPLSLLNPRSRHGSFCSLFLFASCHRGGARRPPWESAQPSAASWRCGGAGERTPSRRGGGAPRPLAQSCGANAPLGGPHRWPVCGVTGARATHTGGCGCGRARPSERRCAWARPDAEATGAPAWASPTQQLGRERHPLLEDSDTRRPIKDHLVAFPVCPLLLIFSAPPLQILW
jgi:hypothetical protein